VLAVLVVCTGNICRSPIAEGFLRDRSARVLGDPLRVGSAGTWARTGKPPTDEAILAAGERGVDIAAQTSTSFRGELARRADLLVTMTEEQRGEVLGQVAEAAGKTFTLKELVTLLRELPAPPSPSDRETVLRRIADADALRRGSGAPEVFDADVADPLGLSLEAYRAVAWEIESLVDELLERLAGQSPAARSAEATEA
jgi:protein-tyrosine phosphatase